MGNTYGRRAPKGTDHDTVTEKSVRVLNARIWGGIVPLSTTRWCAMQLDEREIFQIAYEYLKAVIATFESMDAAENMAKNGEDFEYVSRHLATFEAAPNHLREKTGEDLNSMTAL